ncbi:phosphatidylglycerol lysyltransferase domain-containing protein [Streptomyces sp. NPDC048002]|uniref:phosphatidylglycerol lysyltransferase domain-containing protein n=1 Tax=Streptomyces sp. NPDC048002 TaxID=3154344 RepID=UPI0033FCA6F3
MGIQQLWSGRSDRQADSSADADGQSRAVRLLRRLPFTLGLLLTMLVVALATQSLWRPVEDRSWYPDVAYGLPSFEANRWWTLASGFVFGARPSAGLVIVAAVILLVGFAEWRLGTRWAAAVTLLGHLVAVLASAGLLWLGRGVNWSWAEQVSRDLDVGPSAGAMAAAALATATLSSPWRLRARLALSGYVLVVFLFVGGIADLEHLVGVALGLTASRWLPVPRRSPASGRVSRREWRLFAASGVVLLLAITVTVWLIPAQGPMGSTYGLGGSALHAAVHAVVAAVLVNGLRKGRRAAWWITTVLAALQVLLGALVAVAYALADEADRRDVLDDLPVLVPVGVVWAAELVVLLAGRSAFRVPTPLLGRFRRSRETAPLEERERAVDLLVRYGGTNLSWMTTWPDNSYFFAPSGQAYVAYRKHADVCIALSDPAGAREDRRAAVREFIDFCELHGAVPCLFSTTRPVAEAAEALGWHSVQVAEDTVVSLPGLELTGKRWQKVRSALNRGKKLDVDFELVRLADQPRHILSQVRAISEEWVGDKGLPEMGFTLGGVEEALDPHVRVGLALEGTTVLGVTSWIPVYGGNGQVRGWTLDVMRRRADGPFPPVVEFMIASAFLAFQEEGAEFVSLSGAPLAHSDSAWSETATPFDRLLDQLGVFMEPYYGFRSLHAFKQKFNPRYEPLYLLYRDEADLPRIGVALTRAYMPDAKTGELLRALRKPG